MSRRVLLYNIKFFGLMERCVQCVCDEESDLMDIFTNTGVTNQYHFDLTEL